MPVFGDYDTGKYTVTDLGKKYETTGALGSISGSIAVIGWAMMWA